MSDTYISFTEERNALDYFERAAQFIYEAHADSRSWKWVIISLHGALYGFAICALHGTDWETVTTSTKKGPRLISFPDALAACQDPERMLMTVMSKPLVLNDDQRSAINTLQRSLRNPFEHFIPSTWQIEIHGMPNIAIHCIEVIRFLALDTGNYTMLEDGQHEHIDALAKETIAFLRKMPHYIEH